MTDRVVRRAEEVLYTEPGDDIFIIVERFNNNWVPAPVEETEEEEATQ